MTTVRVTRVLPGLSVCVAAAHTDIHWGSFCSALLCLPLSPAPAHTHACTCTRPFVHTHTHVHRHTRAHLHTHSCICTLKHLCAPFHTCSCAQSYTRALAHTPVSAPQLLFSPGDPLPAAPPLEGAWLWPHLPACLWPRALPEVALAEVWKLFLPVPFKSQRQVGHGAPEGAPCPPRLGRWRRGLPGSPPPAPAPLPSRLILQALKQP